MKVKIASVRVNLITLLRKIEKIESAEEIDYDLIQKVDVINKKLSEIEELITCIESSEEF